MRGNSADAILKRQSSLSHARLLELVAYDRQTGKFFSAKGRKGSRPGLELGHVEANGYRRLMIDGKRYLSHRLAWFYVHGVWPSIDLDHRDLKRDHNWIDNLREATDSQNHANTRPLKSKSGLKGAHWNAARGCWQSYIKINGRSIFLGRFDKPRAAHEAYVTAAGRLQGEFARAA